MPGPHPHGDDESVIAPTPRRANHSEEECECVSLPPQAWSLLTHEFFSYRKEMTHSFCPALFKSYANHWCLLYTCIKHAYIILRWDSVFIFFIIVPFFSPGQLPPHIVQLGGVVSQGALLRCQEPDTWPNLRECNSCSFFILFVN